MSGNRRSRTFALVNRDRNLHSVKTSRRLKTPRYRTLAALGDEPGMEGDIILDRSTMQFCFHNGITWICLTTVTLTDDPGCDASLIIDGTGPDLAIKGLVEGTGISLSNDGSCVTIATEGLHTYSCASGNVVAVEDILIPAGSSGAIPIAERDVVASAVSLLPTFSGGDMTLPAGVWKISYHVVVTWFGGGVVGGVQTISIENNASSPPTTIEEVTIETAISGSYILICDACQYGGGVISLTATNVAGSPGDVTIAIQQPRCIISVQLIGTV